MLKKKLVYFIILLGLTISILKQPALAQTSSPGITRAMEVISERLKRASDSVSRIQLRINTRLEKMKEGGGDTSKLEIAAENIQTQITKLTSAFETLTKLKEATTTTVKNRKNAFLSFRKQVTVVRDTLLNIIKLQKNLVLEMKKL